MKYVLLTLLKKIECSK